MPNTDLSEESHALKANRLWWMRWLFQCLLLVALTYGIGRFGGLRLASIGACLLLSLALTLRSSTRRFAEWLPLLGTLGVVVEFGLDPPGASPTFCLALFSAASLALLVSTAGARSNTRSARWLMRAALVGFVLFGGLTVTEQWARNRYPRAPHGIVSSADGSTEGPYLKHPRFGHLQQPNFRGHFVHPEYRLEAYHTNSDGFRDVEWPSPMPAGERRILCLGDSTMVGFGVLLEEAIPALLDEQLGDWGDLRVLNAATAGYGPRHERYLLEKLLPRCEPDYVVVGFYDGNDLSDARAHLIRSRKAGVHERVLPSETGKLSLKVVETPVPDTLFGLAYWSEYSQFFRLLETRLTRHAASIDTRAPDHAYFDLLPYTSREADTIVEEAHELTMESFTEIAELCEAADAKLLVVRLPARIQSEPEAFEQMIAKSSAELGDHDRALPGSRVLQDCAALGITTLDLLPELELTSPSDPPTFYREGHPNREGCRRAARAIAERIRAM